MSQGLKNLQTAARAHARRERMLDINGVMSLMFGSKNRDVHEDDSGIGVDDLEAEYDGNNDRDGYRCNRSEPLGTPGTPMAPKHDTIKESSKAFYQLSEAIDSPNEGSAAGSQQTRQGHNHYMDVAAEHSLLSSMLHALRYRLFLLLMKNFYTNLAVERGASGKSRPTTAAAGESSSGSASTRTSSATPAPSTKSGENGSYSGKITDKAHGKHGLSNDDENQDGEDGGNKKRPRLNPTKPSTALKTPKFPCPYHKHDPKIFSANEICGRGWPDIAKLK
jgi:hypothetical protein